MQPSIAGTHASIEATTAFVSLCRMGIETRLSTVGVHEVEVRAKANIPVVTVLQPFVDHRRFVQGEIVEDDMDIGAKVHPLSNIVKTGSKFFEQSRQPADPDRRGESVRRNARSAPQRITVERSRSVTVNRDAVKDNQDRPYLRDLYTNPDNETICQACQDRRPFKLEDGSYYVEDVEFLPQFKRHHCQNDLALCPDHAPMLIHANPSADHLRDDFLALESNLLLLTLADQPVLMYLTDTHIADLRAVMEVDDEEPATWRLMPCLLFFCCCCFPQFCDLQGP